MRQQSTFLVISLLLILAACDLARGDGSSSATPEIAVTTIPAATPALQITPDIAVIITATEKTPSLTIWAPPDTVLANEMGTAVFNDILLTFNANHPDVETRVEQKPVTGQGGILSYLRTGANVAPGILPDLIMLPTGQLATAVNEGLIFPLDDEILDPTLFEDLYPAARALAQVGEQTVAYPFAITDLSHLAYQTSVITTTPPLRWADFIENPAGSFIFPAAGSAGANLALQLYLAAGGALTNEAGQPALDAPILTLTLQLLNQGRTEGFILLQSSNVNTLAESWDVFQAGTADYALTTADQFLAKRTPEFSPGYSVIPGPEGPLVPLVEGWAWAISTADPVRRALAAEFLTLVVSEPNLSDWSWQSNRLPARREAFTVWPTDDAYINFLQLELDRAQPLPAAPGGSIMTVLGNAVFDVVSLAKTPQEAAGEAVRALQP